MHRPPVTSGYGRDGEPPPHDDAPAGAAGTMLVLAAQLTMLSTAAVSRSVPLDRMLQVHTVSGFSSGATLAINHGVAFSASVRGIGVLGGSPYGCNILPNGGSGDYTTCSYWTANRSRSAEWLSHCGTYLRARAAHGAVDALEHMANKPVYLFSGTRDSMVWQRTMRAVEQQFRGLGANVYSRFDLAAEHGWIVDNVTCNRPNVPTLDTSGVASTLACCGAHPDLYGTCVLPNVSASDEKQRAADAAAGGASLPAHGCCGACAAGFCEPGAPPDGDCPPGVAPTPMDGPPWWLPPINNCDYDMSGDMFAFLGANGGSNPLKARQAVVSSHLLAFSQAEYVPSNISLAQAAMDGTGFAYVPAPCNGNVAACQIHVHYHPCGGNWQETSLGYMLGSGKAAYAESNAIILLYPQASVAGPWGGCWDWAGSATGTEFDTRHGVQLSAVMRMLSGMEDLVRGGKPMPSEWPPPA